MSLFDKIFKTTAKFCIRHSVEIAMCVAGVGVALTVYTTSKATLKVNDIVKDESLTKADKVKKSIKPAAPAVASIALTYAAISAMFILGKKRQAALLAILASTQQVFQQYRNNVRNEKGSSEEAKIFAKSTVEAKNLDKRIDSIPVPKDNKLIWCESITGQFFEAEEIDVLRAEYVLNMLLVKEGEVTLNEFFNALGIDETDEGNIYGWSQELGYDWFGYMWVDFQHVIHRDKSGREYRLITYTYLPHLNYDQCLDSEHKPVLTEIIDEVMDPLVDTDLWKKNNFPRH